MISPSPEDFHIILAVNYLTRFDVVRKTLETMSRDVHYLESVGQTVLIPWVPCFLCHIEEAKQPTIPRTEANIPDLYGHIAWMIWV